MLQLNYDNSFKKLCVVGSPINHSLSPKIQNFMIQKLNLPYCYLSFDIIGSDFDKYIKACETMQFVGCNVTMPHKQNAYNICDEVFGDAKISKSVNTLFYKNNKWNGFSTDGDGFRLSLLDIDENFKDKTILLIGAGGASSAIAINATKNNAKQIFIVNRDLNKAENIIKIIDIGKAFYFDIKNLKNLAEKSDIIVNCTPLGMVKDFDDFSFLDVSPKVVCDLIYSPPETNFLKYAKQKNHKTINGFDMLLYQGMLSLEIFTDTTFDKRAMKKDLYSLFK